MDGKVYSYATPGNMWNSYESFQPPPLDLQSYIPPSREPFQREPAKDPFLTASSYMFFSYPDQPASHHHQQPPTDYMNQWQGSTFSKLKSYTQGLASDQNIRAGDKLLKDAHSLGTEMLPSDVAEPVSTGVVVEKGVVVPTGSVRSNIQKPCHQHSFSIAQAADEVVQLVGEKTSTRRKNSGFPKTREKPVQTLALKKRARDEESWARNVRKKARSKGESYVSVQGKVVPARSVKPVDCSKCKFNCPSRISEEERHNLFTKYWALETFKEKVDYISSCVHEFAPLRPVSGRRAFSRRYTLKINDREERVCKEFFVTTFDISECTVVTYMAKKRKGPDAITDLRGKQTPSNKTPDISLKCIREHILSQIGLHGELTQPLRDDFQNIKKLYCHYQSECETDNMKPASISVYRKVYAELPKTPFEIPPKDILSQIFHNETRTQLNKDCQTAVKSLDDAAGVCDIGASSQQLDQNRCSAARTGSLGNGSHLDCMSLSYQSSQQTFPAPLGLAEQNAGINVSNTYHRLQGQHTHHYQLYNQQHQHFDLLNNSKLLQSNAVLQNNFPMSTEKNGPGESLCTYAWDPMINATTSCKASVNYCSTLTSSLESHIPQSVSLSSSSLFNYKINSSKAIPDLSVDIKSVNPPALLPGANSLEAKKNTKTSSPKKRMKKAKCHSGQNKRCRNEDSWSRNVRKRLRFKGEAYTSVRGKPVEAKRVKKVDCSKCKFKCTSRITEEQREKFNLEYWSLDTYQKKIEYLTKFVETYTPKRKMTGRRAFTRKYTFNVEGHEERVCKDFFKTTLHISESTIATALEKSRKGPEAIVDMRGKHKPVNKTTEETLQRIREMIIYMTGLRPHRATSNGGRSLGYECKDVQYLYQVYKYDCEKKSKNLASLGIFRNVFMKEFQVKSLDKSKKKKGSDIDSLKACSSTSAQLGY